MATNNKIAAIYRSGGDTDPLIPVVTVPAGENVTYSARPAVVGWCLPVPAGQHKAASGMPVTTHQ